MIFLVIPVKRPAAAKSRLSPILSPDRRAALARSMYEHVLAAALAARGVDRVLVASSDRSTLHRARSLGALVLEEAVQDSHSRSADEAARFAQSLGALTVASLPADIPLVTAAEIEQLIAPPLPALRLVPDAAGTGTNGLVRTPPLAIPARFGPGSFAAHLEEARRLGLSVEVVRPPGIVFDVDTPEDYERLLLARCP